MIAVEHRSFKHKGVLYLYDAATRCRPSFSSRYARVIAFSSPSRENTDDLVKNEFINLHMPIWSKEELLYASKLDQYINIGEQTVESLFGLEVD